MLARLGFQRVKEIPEHDNGVTVLLTLRREERLGRDAAAGDR